MEYNFNYKLKFQVSLHLHHLSQVRARCSFGVHTVHVWLTLSALAVRIWLARVCARCASSPLAMRVWLASGARAMRVWLAHGARLARPRCASGSPTVRVWLAHDARLARPRCASGSPAASSHGSWSLNQQTSMISLLLS